MAGVEPHVGGGNGMGRGGGGGGNGSYHHHHHNDGTAEPSTAAVAAAWHAAGDAWMWAASIRGHAAWGEHRKAWEAKAEADDSLGLVAAAGARVVDVHGKVDTAAMNRAAEAMRRASATFARAAEAFRRSSALNKRAAADEDMAAASYGRAGDYERAETSKDRAERMRGLAADESETADVADEGTAALARDAGTMHSSAAKWGEGGQRWKGDKAALDEAHRVMHNDARHERMRSAAMLERAAGSEQVAARVQKLAAAAARSMAEESTASLQRGDPGAQDALAELRRAMAAANAAEAEVAGGSGGAGGADAADRTRADDRTE